MATNTKIKVNFGTGKELLNAPFSECPLIIDIRDPEDYFESHICGALNAKTREQIVQAFIDNEGSWETLKTLFIYGIQCNEKSQLKLIPLIDSIIRLGLPNPLKSSSDDDPSVPNEAEINTIYFINDFDLLKMEFSFLFSTGSNEMHAQHSINRPGPSQVFYPSLVLTSKPPSKFKLYLGSAIHAKDIRVLLHLGISVVLNITSEVPNFHEGRCGVDYLRLACKDEDTQQMNEVWALSTAAIKSCREQDVNILIHCHAGRSRSASCVIHYLMVEEKQCLEEALLNVKECRSIVNPNDGFRAQLQRIEKAIEKESQGFKRSASTK